MLGDLVIPGLLNGISGLSLGYHTGIVNGVSESIVKFVFGYNGDKNYEVYLGVFTACILVGCIIGGSLGAWIADWKGRIAALWFAAFFNIAPAIALAFIRNIWGSSVVRLLLGVGVGACSCVGPIYVNETVESKYRGRVGSAYQLLVTFGIFFAYVMNYAFVQDDYNKDLKNWQWQWQFIIGLIPGILFVFVLPFSKESEQFKNKQNKPKEEKKTAGEKKKLPVRDIVIASIFGLLSQFSGINAVIYYSAKTLNDSGLDPLIGSMLVVGLWNMVSVWLVLPFFDRFGRRPIMVTSYIGLTVGNLIMSIAQFTDESWLNYVGLAVFIGMFELGPGCLFWVVAPELFSAENRELGMGVSLGVNNLSNLIVSTCFPIVTKAIGGGGSFLIFTGICFLGIIFLYVFLPESSKQNLDKVVVEIDDIKVKVEPNENKPESNQDQVEVAAPNIEQN